MDQPLKPSERTIVFCHRAVNDSWQRSFSHQSCEASLTRTLSVREQEKVEMLLSSDTRFAAAFERYQTEAKAVDLVANLGFGGLGEDERADFSNLCDKLLADRIEAGLTMDDVLTLFRSNGLDSHLQRLPQQLTLQLIAPGHEVQEGRFVYRRYRNLSS